MLTDLLVFSSTVSLTYAVVYSKVFKPLRDLCDKWNPTKDLIHCTFCTGFWIGLLVYWQRERTEVLMALTGAMITYIFFMLVKPLFDKYEKNA
jgi:hypothetical protein